MTLAEAVHLLAAAGCRIVADQAGGIAVDVPAGAALPGQVLEVLAAHRAELTAVAAPAPRADLHDYLAAKGVAGHAAQLVEHAAQAFAVRHDRITIDRDNPEPSPVFFEPGIPFLTLADTEWGVPGGGTRLIAGGTVGLAIPQVWAIDDPFERHGIEAILESIKRRKLPRHIPVWLDGHPRVLEIALVDFENATAPPGMNLLPWRPRPQEPRQ